MNLYVIQKRKRNKGRVEEDNSKGKQQEMANQRRNRTHRGKFAWWGIGILFCAVFARNIVATTLFQIGTVATNGTITSCTLVRNQRNGTICNLSVEFQTQSGQSVTFNTSGFANTYHVGGTVTVRYHPQTPDDAQIDGGWFLLWQPLLIVAGVGVLVSVVRLLLLLEKRWPEEGQMQQMKRPGRGEPEKGTLTTQARYVQSKAYRKQKKCQEAKK